MRLKISFSIKPYTKLPLNYNHFLTSAVYRYLFKADKEYSSKLHNLNSYKFFTFSWLETKKKIEGEYFKVLSDKVSWYISSPSKDFINTVASGIIKTGTLEIGNLSLELSTIEVLGDVNFNSNVKFICISPLVVTTKKYHKGRLMKYYYKPDDDQNEISEKIKNNLIKKYTSFYGTQPDGTIQIKFDNNYKGNAKVLIHYIKGNLDIKIPAIMCPFEVNGSENLIKFGYECGFGELNSSGFGMVKVVDSNITSHSNWSNDRIVLTNRKRVIKRKDRRRKIC